MVRRVNLVILFIYSLLFIFVILKLTGHLTWHWAWILSPLWIPFSFIMAIMLISYAVFKMKLHFLNRGKSYGS
ncbi:MAG: hypothetical protein IKN04_03360 [Clostridia bacterium]|nr:hypothetical protein [Clostridia bacterium]